jgi:hypothetical protein
MTDTLPLRSAVTGLLSFAAAAWPARRAGPAGTLAEAIEANPELRANASRDPDLRAVREACT